MAENELNGLDDIMSRRVHDNALAERLRHAIQPPIDISGHTPVDIYMPHVIEPMEFFNRYQVPLIRQFLRSDVGDEHRLTGAGTWLDPRSGGRRAVATDLIVHTLSMQKALNAVRWWIAEMGLPPGSQIQVDDHYDELTADGWRLRLPQRDFVLGRAFDSRAAADRYRTEFMT